MTVIQVKKYKIKKDENGNKVQISKSKEEWNKDTCNGIKTWYFYDRYELNGVIHQYTSKVFALKREAEEAEREFLNNPVDYIKNHSKRAKNNIDFLVEVGNKEKTLNEYYPDFKQWKLHYIKNGSVYNGEKIWNKHIAPLLGGLTPEQLTFETIFKWYENANIKISSKNQKPYSTQSKNTWHSVLSEFMQYLVSNNKINVNYAKAIGTFKNPKENKNRKKKIKYQTLEEFNDFMSVVDDDFWYAFFNFLFWHGCRKGEQRALSISDVLDYNFESVHFHNNIARNNLGGEEIGSIKNNKERTITLAEQSKKYIINLVEFYKKLNGYNENWFLFGGSNWITNNMIARKLNYYYDKLEEKFSNKKINRLTHHEFGRHSHASYLLFKGNGRTDIYEIIAQRIGDTVEVVRDTYAHPYEDENDKKAKELLKI